MGETITLKAADGHSFAAYTAGPKDAKKGLIVIQEIFGVNHHIRNVVDQWAARGYLTIAPALFDRAEPGIETGYDADDRKRGMEARGKVPEAGAIADIEAASKWLGDKPKGVIGFCWGGSLAWLTATRTNAVKAASAWYGGGIAATKDEKAKVPVQMHFGEKDGSIPMTDVDAVRAAQPKADVYVYLGAQHGFGCDERGSYSKPDYDLAQSRTLEFFAKNLG